MHTYMLGMTKVVSLADDAYEALRKARRPGESFSDVARRLGATDRRGALLDPKIRLRLSEKDAQAWIDEVYRERDQSLRPRTERR